MQVGTIFRCLFPVTICLSVSIDIHASERKENHNDLQADYPPGQNSESYPDIVIPESVLRSRDVLLQLDVDQLPDIAVRPELPDRPVRPEIPARAAKPERPDRPNRPNRPDKPGKP